LDSRTKLKPLLNSPLWDLLEEYLRELEQKELRALVRATSEQEVYRRQGRASLVEQLALLKRQVLGDN
jgi:polyhydroxyalkanoate synthesis regulator phasin